MRDRHPIHLTLKFMFSLRNFTGLCSASGLLMEPVSLGPGIADKLDSARQSYTEKKKKRVIQCSHMETKNKEIH